MFNIFSWQHLFVLAVIALVVVGPKDLPQLIGVVAKWARKGKSVADGFRKNFDDFSRSSELNELHAEMNALKKKTLSEMQTNVPPVPRPPRG